MFSAYVRLPDNENDTRGNYRFTASQRPRQDRSTNGGIEKHQGGGNF